ncbi:transglutaminase domain-containing protein [Novosphingobium sp. BL-52-GroH]|uniref:transglutaminase domain-containing protein n=1 Tax=Novosphingobium sp. BL-52-GroH TaxID=3349877 RepID=UPI00384D6AD5
MAARIAVSATGRRSPAASPRCSPEPRKLARHRRSRPRPPASLPPARSRWTAPPPRSSWCSRTCAPSTSASTAPISTPATAEETWQRRYGDCKGKTALLLALLRELGIEAQAVLANNSGNDNGLAERLPSPRMFDHVLVRARIRAAAIGSMARCPRWCRRSMSRSSPTARCCH